MEAMESEYVIYLHIYIFFVCVDRIPNHDFFDLSRTIYKFGFVKSCVYGFMFIYIFIKYYCY
jgi:hypothetical protein